MDVNDIRAWITVATFIAFLGVCWWAYRGANRERFARDAMLPFESDRTPAPPACGDGDE